MPIPVVESVAYSVADADPSEEIDVADGQSSLVQPAGLTTGEFIFPVVGIESDGSTVPPFDDVDNKPVGCTLIQEFGDAGNIDVWGAAYVRQITGAESWPLVVDFIPGDATVDFGGIVPRVSGVNAANPINAIGATVDFLSVTDKIVLSVTTTAADCLGVAVFIFDGADGAPITVHADSIAIGWSMLATRVINTGAVGVVLAIATKAQATAGALGDCRFSTVASDGGSGFMYAIEGDPGGGGITLTVPDFASGTSLEAVALTQAHVLAPDEIAVAVDMEAVALVQANVLAVDEIDVAMSLENTVLTQANVLVVDSLQSLVNIDAVALTQQHILSPDDIAVASQLETTALTQAAILVVQELTAPTNMEVVELATGLALSVAELLAATSMEGVTLTQAHIIAVSDIETGTSMEEPTLATVAVLAPDDVQVGNSLESVQLSTAAFLQVQEILSQAALESPGLLQSHVLVVPDMEVNTDLQAVTLGGGSFVSNNMIIVYHNRRIVNVKH